MGCCASSSETATELEASAEAGHPAPAPNRRERRKRRLKLFQAESAALERSPLAMQRDTTNPTTTAAAADEGRGGDGPPLPSDTPAANPHVVGTPGKAEFVATPPANTVGSPPSRDPPPLVGVEEERGDRVTALTRAGSRSPNSSRNHHVLPASSAALVSRPTALFSPAEPTGEAARAVSPLVRRRSRRGSGTNVSFLEHTMDSMIQVSDSTELNANGGVGPQEDVAAASWVELSQPTQSLPFDRLPHYYPPVLRTMSGDIDSFSEMLSGDLSEGRRSREQLRCAEMDARSRVLRVALQARLHIVSLFAKELFLLERSHLLQVYFLHRSERLLQVTVMAERCHRKQLVRDCATRLRSWHTVFEQERSRILTPPAATTDPLIAIVSTHSGAEEASVRGGCGDHSGAMRTAGESLTTNDVSSSHASITSPPLPALSVARHGPHRSERSRRHHRDHVPLMDAANEITTAEAAALPHSSTGIAAAHTPESPSHSHTNRPAPLVAVPSHPPSHRSGPHDSTGKATGALSLRTSDPNGCTDPSPSRRAADRSGVLMEDRPTTAPAISSHRGKQRSYSAEGGTALSPSTPSLQSPLGMTY